MELLKVGKIFLGIIYLAGAMVNFIFVLFRPEVYQSFADVAVIPLYRKLWMVMVIPHLRVWLALVIVFEITVGLFILGKGIFVKIGLAGATLFNLFLVPFWWAGLSPLSNLPLALGQAFLLKEEYKIKAHQERK